MPASATPSVDSIVFAIITRQAESASGESKRPTPWWLGLTLDEQDELLDRIDPQNYGPGQSPPMPVGRWNRQKRRVRRARDRWIQEIAALRKPCRCENCRRHNRPPFPKYYVASVISYECWLEQQAVDPELEDELKLLRNDRPHIGSVVDGRQKGSTKDGIFHAYR